MNNQWKKRGITDKFNAAFEGIFETIRAERHMKYHCFSTIVVIILSLFIELKTSELLMVIGAIALIWLAELFNTAIETCVDMITTEYNLLAKKAKDIAAGAVLVASINALFIGYIVFGKKISFKFNKFFFFLKYSYRNTIFFIFILIISLVILIKLLSKKGTPLRGGFPSGHSALSASILTLITSLTDNPKIFFLALILTILVIHSRIEGKIHTFFETMVGAFLGWSVTYLILILVHG